MIGERAYVYVERSRALHIRVLAHQLVKLVIVNPRTSSHKSTKQDPRTPRTHRTPVQCRVSFLRSFVICICILTRSNIERIRVVHHDCSHQPKIMIVYGSTVSQVGFFFLGNLSLGTRDSGLGSGLTLRCAAAVDKKKTVTWLLHLSIITS